VTQEKKKASTRSNGGNVRAAKPKPRPAAKPTVKAVAKSAAKPKAPAAKRKRKRAPGPDAAIQAVVLDALSGMKALEVKVLDVRGLTDIADTMVIASGTSDRHVRSIAQRVVEKVKEAGQRPHGVEGLQDGDWVLIDLHEMIVHVMLPRVREFYGLEKLWDVKTAKRAGVRA
jgi:ribosome-associated protein